MSDIVLNSDDALMKLIEDEVLHWQTILVLLSKQTYPRIRVLTFTLLKNFFVSHPPHNLIILIAYQITSSSSGAPQPLE